MDLDSMPAVDTFLRGVALDRHWDEFSIQSVRAGGEETLTIMVQYEDEEQFERKRRLMINAHPVDDDIELEFLSTAYDVENLEDRLAYLDMQPEVPDEAEISYRLLRHYASSVKHQKFHNMDVITVRVEGKRVREVQ
ncbi:MAG: hypothetical protein F4X57_00260 [Chloroflexi bacterium]|nr:hypothetical protein [Chloroflexota bacterium]